MKPDELYLDLEETIIKSFYDGTLTNVAKIKRYIDWWGIKKVSIFSFAIHYDKDVQVFWDRHAKNIENVLGVQIRDVIPIPLMMKADREYTGLVFDPDNGIEVTDWINTRGKTDAFRYWILDQKIPGVFTLIDDVVPMLDMVYHTEGIHIHYLNVDKMIG